MRAMDPPTGEAGCKLSGRFWYESANLLTNHLETKHITGAKTPGIASESNPFKGDSAQTYLLGDALCR